MKRIIKVLKRTCCSVKSLEMVKYQPLPLFLKCGITLSSNESQEK